MKKFLKVLTCLMIIISSTAASIILISAQEYKPGIFIDANKGNDNNAGTFDNPIQSLTRAQELIREKTNEMDKDLYVYLRGGTYLLDETITFTSADSGKNGHNVIWSAFNNEEVIISGGTSISNWTKVDDEKNIWQASAKGLESRDLYVNGKRATRARSELKAYEFTKKYIYVDAEGLPASFSRPSDLEVVFARKWKWCIEHVSSIGPNDDYENCQRIKITDESYNSLKTNLTGAAIDAEGMRDGVRYLENAYELLDETGEWYLNTEEDRIYYIPQEGQDMNNIDTVLGRLENLVVFDGQPGDPVKNITFTGLTFQYTTWLKPNWPDGLQTFQASAIINPEDVWDREWIPSTGSAIYGKYVDNINIVENNFKELGNAGVHLGRATKNSSITNNKFENLAGGGLLLGDVTYQDHIPVLEDLTENNKITDNYITNVGETYRACAGILVGFTKGTTVEYNTVKNLPYTGISVGWGWGYNDFDEGKEFMLGNNSISYNYVENVLTEPSLIDGGGIYTLGRQDDSIITGNYIDGVCNEYGGIYLDEGSCGFTITNNVLTNCVRNWLYKGDYNYIYDNYATKAQEPDRDERLPIGLESQYRFENNDMWDETVVAAIKAAAGVRIKLEPEKPIEPDDPIVDVPETNDPNLENGTNGNVQEQPIDKDEKNVVKTSDDTLIEVYGIMTVITVLGLLVLKKGKHMSR